MLSALSRTHLKHNQVPNIRVYPNLQPYPAFIFSEKNLEALVLEIVQYDIFRLY